MFDKPAHTAPSFSLLEQLMLQLCFIINEKYFPYSLVFQTYIIIVTPVKANSLLLGKFYFRGNNDEYVTCQTWNFKGYKTYKSSIDTIKNADN